MRIAVCGDVHYCKKSSILQRRGSEYTIRLENLIKTIQWFEQTAKDYGCEFEVFLGDFFDTATLDAETITSLKELHWNDLPKAAIVGNHESEDIDLHFSTLHIFHDKMQVINKPAKGCTDVEFCYLPYILESERKPLAEYFGPLGKDKRIIFSHNDIKGINYGGYVSKIGFDLDEIRANSNLFINGHLHNGTWVNTEKTILNLGNCSGENFTENASEYSHNICIIDTDTMDVTLIENPYAFNFYKIDVNTEEDLKQLDKIKNNAVLSVRCNKDLVLKAKELLAEKTDKIVESRIVITQLITGTESEATLDATTLTVNHIAEFEKCCRMNIENTDVLEQELSEICK